MSQLRRMAGFDGTSGEGHKSADAERLSSAIFYRPNTNGLSI